MSASPEDVNRLLADLKRGDAGYEEVFACLYEELREVARRQRQRWQGDYTMNTTAVLHEAYVKLADGGVASVTSREHVLALAARAIRHILCNYARERRALRRGGGMEHVELDDRAAAAAGHGGIDDATDEVIALDAALTRLAAIDARQSRVIECRFFGGLSVEETAVAMGISPRTVKRDWAVAQAWLHRELAAAR